MKAHFMKKGDCFLPSSGDSRDIHNDLPGGNYLIKFNPFSGPYFEISPRFELPSKMYGRHVKDAERILSTFQKRTNTTGVLLAGDKGTGKTLVSKTVANKAADAGIPTILINEPLSGDSFNSLLSAISQPVILLLDEFEKVYDSDKQQELLTLLDGVFTGQRMFLFTTNDKWKIDPHMLNRPGRIYYHLEYVGVDAEFIREFCEDNLRNKGNIESVCLLGTIFSEFNFDMLQAIVEEMNRYNEDASQVLKWLNVKMTMTREDRYVMTFRKGDKVYEPKELHRHGVWAGNPMTDSIDLHYSNGKDEHGNAQFEEEDFYAQDLIRMDVKTGTFIYRNENGCLLKLKRNKEIPKGLDLSHFVNKSSTEGQFDLTTV